MVLNKYTAISLMILVCIPSIGHSNHERIAKRGSWLGYEIEYIESEVIVGVQENTPREFFDVLKTEHIEIELLPARLCGIQWLKISSKNTNAFHIIQKLSGNEFVEYVEPNIIGKLHHDIYYPNDQFYIDRTQWALNNTGQCPPGGLPDADIDAPEAWDIERGDTNTIMVILDTGIPLDLNEKLCHPEFSDTNRIIVGPNFSCGGGSLRDYVGHGTHVAGIVGAETNNGEGIAGVCGGGKLLIIKIDYEPDGWSVAQAIVWTVHYAREHPNKRIVMNLSGGWGYPIDLLEYAVWYLDQHNIVFVSTVGNYHSSFPGLYAFNGFIPRLNHPDGYPNVIAVGASDPWDNKAWYSAGYGTILAPGGSGNGIDEEDIFSTLPNYYCPGFPQDYGYMAGTSMAAPHVTGVAGLMLSAHPSLSDSVVRHIIAITADDQGDREPFGYPPQKCGRINAYKSVVAAIGIPVFVGFKNHEINANEYLEFEVYAYDIDTREIELDYSVVGDLPNGAEFSRDWPMINKNRNRSGTTPYIPPYTFRWTPTMAQIGTHSIVFRVADPEDNKYEDTVTIDVNPPDNGTFSSGRNISSNEPILVEIVQYFTTVQFTLDINQEVYVTLKIYDITGRLVTTLIQNEFTSGAVSLYWNEKDLRGKKVSNGIYFVELDAGNSLISKKIVLLR
jgi:thermitase